VKKGDTLYSIGLEFGYDYKDIAQNNNLQPPYVIRIGQQLKLPKANEITSPAGESGTVITALKTEPPATTKSLSEPPLFSEPKAVKEPYSEQAMVIAKSAESAPKPVKRTAIEKPAEKPIENTNPEVPKTESPDVKAAAPASSDEAIEWAWPVNGKVVASFNEAASAKGIDIGGSAGQAVHASAPGKVVYSGSGLRGYGKLIIIKHNKTYLSAYAHNSQILVKEGQEISKGQKIAEMGNTDTDRVKLHFEIRRLGKPVDPIKYLPGSPA
jgi:lipoprotein NlpD